MKNKNFWIFLYLSILTALLIYIVNAHKSCAYDVTCTPTIISPIPTYEIISTIPSCTPTPSLTITPSAGASATPIPTNTPFPSRSILIQPIIPTNAPATGKGE